MKQCSLNTYSKRQCSFKTSSQRLGCPHRARSLRLGVSAFDWFGNLSKNKQQQPSSTATAPRDESAAPPAPLQTPFAPSAPAPKRDFLEARQVRAAGGNLCSIAILPRNGAQCASKARKADSGPKLPPLTPQPCARVRRNQCGSDTRCLAPAGIVVPAV